MKIFISGGAGFIGSNFIHYWLDSHPHDQILNFDKLTYAGSLGSLTSLRNLPNYRFIKGDICSPSLVNRALIGCDWVVHFAAESHVDRSIKNPAQFVKTNVLGTQVLLEAALKAGVERFHHVSTDEVFGSLPLESPRKFSESTCYSPRSPYAASKAASDHLVRAFFHTYGLPITISNCSNNYGPFQNPEKFIPLVITNLLQNRKIPIYGDGLYVRDWLYVTDHCRAIETILKQG
ncbi:dTDP-glucose 4,6-dehydratase, partial [Patescibacteria group bacterium]